MKDTEPGSDAEATFPQLLMRRAQGKSHDPAMREKQYGIWQTLTWEGLLRMVRAIAVGLVEAGVARGDHVVIIGSNRPRLYASMLAVQSIGSIPIPLYQDAMVTEYVFPIRNASVGWAIVEDQEQVDKLLEVRLEYPELANIWYDDARGLRNSGQPGLQSLDALMEAGALADRAHPNRFEVLVAAGRADDVAAMYFTSGTTGNPKGVVHTFRALIDRSLAGASFDKITSKEEVLAYLPPAWVGQSIFSYAMWLVCGYVVNCPESPDTVTIDMNEIGPTYYFAPPRVFEGLLTSVMIRMEDAGGLKRVMFNHCMGVARRIGPALMDGRPVGPLGKLNYAVGNLLIYGPLRNALGMSRVRVAYTAGEAIGPDLFNFFRSIGINLKQLYGSTETAVFVCLQPDHEAKADTVGVPIDGVKIKFTESSEILVHSPGLFKGYYKNPAATAEVLDVDGWYHTGDAGFIDAGGHLKIIDRAKDVGRLANGAMFAPKYVENKLKFFPYIKEVVAIGHQRDLVCVFVNIDYPAVGSWAEKHNLPYAGYADLAGKAEVYELVLKCIEKVNADLVTDELLAGSQISRFLILHKELDADDGELTRTNKVRRGFVEAKYATLVEALYHGRMIQEIETSVTFEDGRTSIVSANLRIMDSKLCTQV
ncbi:MAG: long-chain fatty acid--CoA ligase [Alcaligenaceae bacterium]|nr:MAG: long-chain fatty acid--CoA ligase [Alcaligenaceae bacterium]